MTRAGSTMRRVSRSQARRAARIAGVMLVLTVGIAWLGAAGCGSASPSPRASDGAADLSNTTTAADGGHVRVVEYAFQPTAIPPDYRATSRALVGIVLENTSKQQQAVSTKLTVQLFDADGRSLFQPGGSPAAGPNVGAPLIPPGGRIGVGIEMVTGDDAGRHRTPLRMAVTVGPSDWGRPDEKPEIGITNVALTQNPDGSAVLKYTSHAPDLKNWASVQIPLVNVLFRDPSGKLLGGTALFHARVGPWTSGTASHQIQFAAQEWKYTVPAGADLAKTEVYGSIDGG